MLSAQSFDTKTWFWLNVHKPVTRYIEYYGAIALLLAYLWAALRLLRPSGPRWPRRLLMGLGGFYLAAALDPLVNSTYLPQGAPKFYLTSLVLPGLAYGLALLGWRWRRPATVSALADAPVPPPLPPPSKPLADIPIDSAQLARVVAALANEQLFKDPDLTLDALARHLGLTPNAVSQLLNNGLRQSFSEVVNGYRLAEVKQRLLGPDVQRLTVLAIAFEAGFNSKTTFNRVFKEKTGLTPKEYQKRYHPTHRDDTVPASG
jgi:AraC-like DNA-binding protein